MKYEQIEVKSLNPEIDGWYDTSDGNLYWHGKESEWSCREEYISEEYPKYWYKPPTELTDVVIILTSSDKEIYVNDEQRIGFQKGAKWMRDQLSPKAKECSNCNKVHEYSAEECYKKTGKAT